MATASPGLLSRRLARPGAAAELERRDQQQHPEQPTQNRSRQGFREEASGDDTGDPGHAEDDRGAPAHVAVAVLAPRADEDGRDDREQRGSLGVMLLDFADFRPLAVIILRMIRNIRAILEAINQPGVASVPVESIPTHSVRMATAAVTIGPILLVYPFVQQYFIKGLTLGAVKG